MLKRTCGPWVSKREKNAFTHTPSRMCFTGRPSIAMGSELIYEDVGTSFVVRFVVEDKEGSMHNFIQRPG
jgi:hypothetical protein